MSDDEMKDNAIEILLLSLKTLPLQVVDDSELGLMYSLLYTITWMLMPQNKDKTDKVKMIL